MLFVSEIQTPGCYPVNFTIEERQSQTYDKTYYTLFFNFGDTKINMGWSYNKSTLEKKRDRLIKGTKIKKAKEFFTRE